MKMSVLVLGLSQLSADSTKGKNVGHYHKSFAAARNEHESRRCTPEGTYNT